MVARICTHRLCVTFLLIGSIVSLPLVAVADNGKQAAYNGAASNAPEQAELQLARGEWEELRRSPERAVGRARFVPATVDGKRIGYKVFVVAPDSWLAKLGLKNGDLITALRVEGQAVPLEIAASTHVASHAQLVVVRKGKTLTLAVRIIDEGSR